MSKQKYSQTKIDNMFRFILEYSGFEIQGYDEENRIVSCPNPQNKIFTVPTTKSSKFFGGLMPKKMSIYTPPQELFYCAKIILGEKHYKKLHKTLKMSTFQEILNILRLELWGKYCTCAEDKKFIIYAILDKYETLIISTDREDSKKEQVQYNFNPDGSGKIIYNNDTENFPPQTFENVYNLALQIIKSNNSLKNFFNKLFHQGGYEFSYIDSLKLYDEILKISK